MYFINVLHLSLELLLRATVFENKHNTYLLTYCSCVRGGGPPCIGSILAGSAGDPHGIRPQHLVELTHSQDTGALLLSSLTALLNVLISGRCSQDIAKLLFGGCLTAIDKKFGPSLSATFGDALLPNVPALNPPTSSLIISAPFNWKSVYRVAVKLMFMQQEVSFHMPSDNVIVKLDFLNAFNCLHRD